MLFETLSREPARREAKARARAELVKEKMRQQVCVFRCSRTDLRGVETYVRGLGKAEAGVETNRGRLRTHGVA